MNQKKQGRVAERIQEILGTLIQFQVKDPRLQGVTVIDVEIDRELMYATVYVSSLGGEEDREEVMDGLDDANGFLRREVGSHLSLRRVPELRFEWDETRQQAARIEDLLDSLNIPAPQEENEETDAADDAE